MNLTPALVVAIAVSPAFSGELTFEAASVRVNKSGFAGRSGPVADPQRFSWRGATLRQLIGEAYAVEYAQIAGAPAWSDSEVYDVEATAERPSTRDQMRQMLRALLADRFRLSVETRKKTMQVYVLSVARSGLRMRELSEQERSRPEERPAINRLHRRASMAKLATLLSQTIGGPIFNGYSGRLEPRQESTMVVDETGVSGVYDIDLALDSTGSGDFMATLQGALSNLGLRLDLKARPVDVISVSHAERLPTAN
jgi:uncharacterized protein (TIGR03435 family)